MHKLATGLSPGGLRSRSPNWQTRCPLTIFATLPYGRSCIYRLAVLHCAFTSQTRLERRLCTLPPFISHIRFHHPLPPLIQQPTKHSSLLERMMSLFRPERILFQTRSIIPLLLSATSL